MTEQVPSKRVLSIEVRGKTKTWCFTFVGDLQYLHEWRADGLQVFEVVNTVPVWVAELPPPAVRVWCFLQDIFNFKNPFSKD